jgi:hypothetical protein
MEQVTVLLHRKFLIAAALYRTKQFPLESMIQLANEALNCPPLVTPEIIALAIPEAKGWSEMEPLFEKVISSLGLQVPTIDRAFWILARDVIEAIAEQRINPWGGVSLLKNRMHYNAALWNVEPKSSASESYDIENFEGVVYEIGDIQERNKAGIQPIMPMEVALKRFNEYVIEEAKRWLATHPVKELDDL